MLNQLFYNYKLQSEPVAQGLKPIDELQVTTSGNSDWKNTTCTYCLSLVIARYSLKCFFWVSSIFSQLSWWTPWIRSLPDGKPTKLPATEVAITELFPNLRSKEDNSVPLLQLRPLEQITQWKCWNSIQHAVDFICISGPLDCLHKPNVYKKPPVAEGALLGEIDAAFSVGQQISMVWRGCIFFFVSLEEFWIRGSSRGESGIIWDNDLCYLDYLWV